MDIITQGLLGATVAQAGAKPEEVRRASLVGFCAPLLADADALIRSAEDPLLFLAYHRHFTHALAFIPVGALLATLLCWPFLRKRLRFRRLYYFSLLGYATAGLLDACTSYGTHLLWPFSADRIAWSIISIFDPLFSLVLIVALGWGLAQARPRAARVGLAVAVAYLLLGVMQQTRAEALARAQAQQRGHAIERLLVKPTLGNLLLWRSVYASGGTFYVDAVRVGLAHSTFTEGGSVQAFDRDRDLPHLSDETVLYRDIQRFARFSEGFLVWHPAHPDVLGDIRYAMLPTSLRPLWGIALDRDAPNEPVTFETFRTMSDAEVEAFLTLLLD